MLMDGPGRRESGAGVQATSVDVAGAAPWYAIWTKSHCERLVAQQLEAKGFTIDRRKVQLDEPLKQVGEFHIPVKLHREVTAHVAVTVKGEEVEAAAAE